MKRVLALVLVLLLVPGVCMGADEALCGRLTKLNVAEDTLFQAATPYIGLFTGFKFFDSLTSMLAALRSGRIAAFAVDKYTADYLIARTGQYTVLRVGRNNLSYSMLLLEENGELCGKISAAIKDMKSDGTLEAMKKLYIDDCISGTDPKAVKPEHFDGAPTLKIALTGDRPPMDYISVAGEPIGFNPALVSEIAKRLKMNAEFISVDSGARAAALASKTCDAVFWSETRNFNNREGFDMEDRPDHTIITEEYLDGPQTTITLLNSPLLQK